MNTVSKFVLLTGCLMFVGATLAPAQEDSPRLAQVVALDECDSVTFNADQGGEPHTFTEVAQFGGGF